MKWFDKWVMKRAESIMQRNNSVPQPEERYYVNSAKIARAGQTIGDSLDSPAVRFKMFKASGGTIIETTMYDSQRDRTLNGLYVITNDKDIGTEIGKILTMESLKV